MRARLSLTTVCAAAVLALACADDDPSPSDDEQGAGSDSSSDGTTEGEEDDDDESSTFSSETMSESTADGSDASTEDTSEGTSSEDTASEDTASADSSTEASDTNCPPGTFGCPCDQGLCEDPFVCAEDLCQLPTDENCGDIEAQYAALIEASNSCTEDADCQWLDGHCGVGLGGCYNLVNLSVDQGDFDALAALWQDASCSGPVCDCAPPPASVPCVDNLCSWP